MFYRELENKYFCRFFYDNIFFYIFKKTYCTATDHLNTIFDFELQYNLHVCKMSRTIWKSMLMALTHIYTHVVGIHCRFFFKFVCTLWSFKQQYLKLSKFSTTYKILWVCNCGMNAFIHYNWEYYSHFIFTGI